MEIKTTRKSPRGADSTKRAALIGGLRELADYLEANPAIPAPNYPVMYMFPEAGEWAGMCDEINAVAGLLGVAARMTSGGHCVAVRLFGPVEYRAIAIPPKPSSSQESE